MDVYVHNADMYCESCAAKIHDSVESQRLDQESTSGPEAFQAIEDAYIDAYPEGPISDGGGEADTPVHCGGCRVFLESPLTDEGVNYVVSALALDGSHETLTTWFDHYQDQITDVADLVIENGSHVMIEDFTNIDFDDYAYEDGSGWDYESAMSAIDREYFEMDCLSSEKYTGQDAQQIRSIEMLWALLDCSIPGQKADEAVSEFLAKYKVAANPDIADWLKSYGAWSRDDGELDSHAENVARAIWLISSELREHGQAYLGN